MTILTATHVICTSWHVISMWPVVKTFTDRRIARRCEKITNISRFLVKFFTSLEACDTFHAIFHVAFGFHEKFANRTIINDLRIKTHIYSYLYSIIFDWFLQGLLLLWLILCCRFSINYSGLYDLILIYFWIEVSGCIYRN